MKPNYWLLTNTTYGTWLPGDARGFVGHVREHRPEDNPTTARVMHATPGTHYDKAMPGLQRAAAERMKSPPVLLTAQQAELLVQQFCETAHFRNWQLLAIAIMTNHFHMVVGASEEENPSKILSDFKSWGSRMLNQMQGTATVEKWWTQSGSKRLLPHETAIERAVHYVVQRQVNPLAVWTVNSSRSRGDAHTSE